MKPTDAHRERERSSQDGQDLESTLVRLRDACLALDGLSVAQHEAANNGGDDAVASLLELVERRQAVVDEMDRLRAEVAAAWPDPRGSGSAGCGRLLDEIAALVEGVRARDGRDTATLERRRAEVTRELVSLSRGKGAVGAYSGGSSSSSRQRDLGERGSV